MAKNKPRNLRKSATPTPQKTAGVQQQVITVQGEVSSGLIPPPRTLAEYGSVDPDFPKQIFEMGVNQHNHDHDNDRRIVTLNEKMVDGGIAAERRGQWFGFLLCAGALSGGVYLIATGSMPTIGAALAIGALASLAGTFIFGRRRK